MKKLIPTLISTSLLKIVFLLYGGVKRKMIKLNAIIYMTNPMCPRDYPPIYLGTIEYDEIEQLIKLPYSEQRLLVLEAEFNDGYNMNRKWDAVFTCEFYIPYSASSA